MNKANIKNIETWRLATILVTLLILSAPKLHAQSTGQLYALGFNMGLASFQASVVAGTTDPNMGWSALDEVSRALFTAEKLARDMNSSSFPSGELDHWLKYALQWHNFRPEFREAYQTLYNTIVSARDGYTAQLAKSGRSDLVHAYVLGVNIGIAEGQATVGDAARQIVYSSLINARLEAQALGLDLNPLNECIYLANTTTPMREVYAKIVSLRSIYQSSLR